MRLYQLKKILTYSARKLLPWHRVHSWNFRTHTTVVMQHCIWHMETWKEFWYPWDVTQLSLQENHIGKFITLIQNAKLTLFSLLCHSAFCKTTRVRSFPPNIQDCTEKCIILTVSIMVVWRLEYIEIYIAQPDDLYIRQTMRYISILHWTSFIPDFSTSSQPANTALNDFPKDWLT